jgi:hypothetical protein
MKAVLFVFLLADLVSGFVMKPLVITLPGDDFVVAQIVNFHH